MTIEEEHQNSDRNVLTIYPSKWKLLWMNMVSLICMLAGIGIIHLGYLPGWFWIGILIIAFSSLRLLFVLPHLILQVFAPFPILLINEEGIQATVRYAKTTAKWEEISTINLRRVGTNTWFEVALSAEGMESFLSRKGQTTQSSRFSTQDSRVIIIPLHLLRIPAKQVIAKIKQRYQIYIERYHINIRL